MFVLPNLFTVSSIFCGFYAIVLVSGDPTQIRLYDASLAVFFGMFFDMADGRVARLTRTQSAFGVQLDSLADLVTFGVAPAIIAYKWGLERLGLWGAVAGFLYVACGALRLARFNVIASRAVGSLKYFTGLPIPLAAGLIVSLVMFHQRAFETAVTQQAQVLVLMLVLSYLMVSNIRYRTFKDLRVNRKSVLVLVSLVLLFFGIAAQIRPTFALLAFVAGYVAYGLIEEVIFFRRRRREAPPPPKGPRPLPGDEASPPPGPVQRTADETK